MAKQEGLLPISGKIGKLRFFKGRKGNYHVSQHKTTVDKARVMTDERFERTRENMAEFTLVAKATKLIRSGASKLVSRVSDRDVSLRLRSLLFKVIRSDSSHPRGQRIVSDGDLGLLKTFEFSKPGVLESSYNGQYAASIDRPAGTAKVSIPGFRPKLEIKAPPMATHFQFHAGILELNFETQVSQFEIVSGAKIPWNNDPVPAIDLQGSFTAGTVNPVIVLFGIEYWMETNGQQYQIKDQSYNAIVVAGTSQV